jgi:hypothetical protein
MGTEIIDVVETLRSADPAGLELLREAEVIRGTAPRQRLGDYAEFLAQRALGGLLAPPGQRGWDLKTKDGERVQVKARDRHSSPNGFNWFHVANVHESGFDHLALAMFDNWEVTGSWLILHGQIPLFSHSTVKGQRGETTKFSVRGDWRERAAHLGLGAIQSQTRYLEVRQRRFVAMSSAVRG